MKLDLLTMKELLEIVGLMATGVLAIVGFITKYVIKPLKVVKEDIQKNVTDNNTLLTEHSEILKAHTEILKELKFNGGKSIKDIVNKINDKLDTTQRNLDSIVAMVKASYEYEHDGIFIADKHGNCYYFNKSYLDITGLSFNEALNFGWINAIHPKDTEKILAAWKTCISTMSNMELVHSYKNVKSKRVVKAKVSWQVQVQPTETSDETVLIFGRVKLIDKNG